MPIRVRVSNVSLANSDDGGVEVYKGNATDGSFIFSLFSNLPQTAQYINIMKVEQNILTICEVEVYQIGRLYFELDYSLRCSSF